MASGFKKAGIPIFILIGAIVIMVSLGSMKKQPEKEEQIEKDFLVDAKPLEFGNVEFLVYSQGSVQPKNQTMLSTQVSGRVIMVAENFVEGGFFKKGDILVQLEDDDYQTDLLLAEAELARAQASLDEEKARGEVAAQEWRSFNKGSAPELGLRKPQLAREQATVKAAQASLQRAKRNLERTNIRAPYDGLVKSRNVDLGQFVGLGAQLGEVFSTDVAEVRLPLTDDDVAFLDDLKANKPTVTLSTDVAGKEVQWQGSLVRDEAILDGRSRVIYGVVEVNDPYQLLVPDEQRGEELRFGRFVKAEITGVNASNIVVLPRNVLRLDGTVLTVDENKQININFVSVQRADENFIYINDGFNPEHKVVMSAVPNPYNGMPVRFLGDEDTSPPSGIETRDNSNDIEVKQ
ncbi:efflux RND transporter periplasmic adaptor subunit [Glaciecola sp. MH2013]|uniref:efflux RND transporter periplasmic adaptor subunit n=1 Tax=Glaciecola sp. MH2013 TaxID=2785524 RepID=UPI00189E5FD7|nr:efflux RND transporter periplasmic adaptor subunit [Glaciecola sp. MH2013]MBF7072754.1 efflux RND transporter periplasmic adaptor subunit [Glaciecola sp. MH2013]